MTETFANAATAAPRSPRSPAARADRARDTAKDQAAQAQPSPWATDEPPVTAEAPPRWPRVFPGL